jgi:hypothetical protein
VVALLAGCGSGGDGDDASPPKKTTTSTSSSSTTAPEAGASTTTTTAGGGSTTTEPGKDGGEQTDPTIADGDNPEGDLETSPLDTLPSGTHFGYLKGISSGLVEGQAVSIVQFDKVEFLTGQAAVDAAHAAGDIPEDQDYVENDYYIVNDNPTLRSLAVVPDAQVSVIESGSPDPQPAGITDAVATPGLYEILVQNVRGITTITSVQGVFLP